MIRNLKKYYLGAWQNIYHINWPIRFLLELAALMLIAFFIWKFLKFIVKKYNLKPCLVKAWYWIVTEIAHFIGHDNDWEVDFDRKMIDWASEMISGKDGNKKKSSLVMRVCFWLGMMIIYFLAVFVDLPVSVYLSDYYLSELGDVKTFFQSFEIMLSKGYEQYPPLFVRVEQEKAEEAMEEIVEQEEKATVYIQLNEKGKNGSNIRSETDLDNDDNIIGGVNRNSQILYRDEWTYDGERYWLRVYVPDDDIEGWLSGNLVESAQVEALVTEGTK